MKCVEATFWETTKIQLNLTLIVCLFNLRHVEYSHFSHVVNTAIPWHPWGTGSRAPKDKKIQGSQGL